MCRCNEYNSRPYCDYCNNLIPKRSVHREGTKLYDILMTGWKSGLLPDQAKQDAQDAGYIITYGEVEMVFSIFDEQLIRNMRG